MNPSACSLDAVELAEQFERYRAIGRLAAAVEHEPGRVVVCFTDDPPSALIERALEVERRCCPFFEVEYDPVTRRLSISADHPDRRHGVGAIAGALTEFRSSDLLPDGTPGHMLTAPGVMSCCSPSALQACCAPQDKEQCCGEPLSGGGTARGPSSCACTA